METAKQTTLVNLTTDFVEIQTIETADVNGKIIIVDDHRGLFQNSKNERVFIENLDIPQRLKNAIFAAWDDEPMVEYPEQIAEKEGQ